jgi:catechol 2,3-dioxygenase-like lactoylglutathione lyase family enzyme
MQNKLTTANVILYCRQWDQTVCFYRDQLKLPVLFSTDWFVEFRLNSVSRVSIADEKRCSIKSCGGHGVTLALEVEDIAAMRQNMDQIGLKPTSISEHPWNAMVFYLFDPEGHRIEIWQPIVSQREQSKNNEE